MDSILHDWCLGRGGTVGPCNMQMPCNMQIWEMILDLHFPGIQSSQKKYCRCIEICSFRIIQNKGKKQKYTSAVGSKTRSTHDLHPSTPRDPTDFAGPMKFCVIGMLVNVINTIHGNFGAVDPIRFNCKHESYLWGDKHVTRFNLHQERLPKHVLLWLTVADGATNAKMPCAPIVRQGCDLVWQKVAELRANFDVCCTSTQFRNKK